MTKMTNSLCLRNKELNLSFGLAYFYKFHKKNNARQEIHEGRISGYTAISPLGNEVGDQSSRALVIHKR